MDHRNEDELLKSSALKAASSQPYDQELAAVKRALELKTLEIESTLVIMKATLESTTDAILVADSHGNISDHNQRFLNMWNIDSSEDLPKKHDEIAKIISHFVSEPYQYMTRVTKIYEESPDESYDLLELHDGRVIERFSRSHLMGSPRAGRVWSFRDISEVKRLEAERHELLLSERTARTEAEKLGYLKDEFLTTLSHELRTPLTAILGWCHIIQRDINDPKKVATGIEDIERNARIQTQLVADLLDMSRILEGKMRLDVQHVQLPSIIADAIESIRPAADAKGVRIEAILDPIYEAVVGDPARLQQIMWNLLSNAVKFTPKMGKIQVVLFRINSHIEITVADTGKGISEEFLVHVFERFRQADASSARVHGGLGIGLALVKQLVDLHGGKIRAESKGEGLGTTFTVELPLAVAVHANPEDRQHPINSNTPSTFENPDLTNIKALVVDDDHDARILVRRLLEECGASVMTCSSAEEALSAIVEDLYDILISDIGMPGKDGYMMIKELRSLDILLPAIALTAFARSADRTRALNSGFQGHVAKPVEPAELLATISSLVGHFPQKS